MATKSTVIPALRYRDAHKAIEFLCNGFGFEKQAVYDDEKGGVAHAQLVFGGGMIMLGSGTHEGEYGRWVQPPTKDSVTTSGIYMIVRDCDAHYARAKKAGAVILKEPVDESYGGRGYSCRDLEGYVWSFGTFDPWAPEVPNST